MITSVIFASSLLLASLIVITKGFELKREKEYLPLRIIGKLDGQALAMMQWFKFRTLQIIQSIRYIVLVYSRSVVEALLHRIKDRIRTEYQVRQEVMMGRRNIGNRGSVSFYLKKITEMKESGSGGKIEDRLDVA